MTVQAVQSLRSVSTEGWIRPEALSGQSFNRPELLNDLNGLNDYGALVRRAIFRWASMISSLLSWKEQKWSLTRTL
jgi:hypothetical protein